MNDAGMLSRVADSLYWMARYLERAEHSARVRFFVSCEHTEEQIRHTVAVVAEEMARLG